MRSMEIKFRQLAQDLVRSKRNRVAMPPQPHPSHAAVSDSDAEHPQEMNEEGIIIGNLDLPVDEGNPPVRPAGISSGSDMEVKNANPVSSKESLFQEPHFDLGVPGPGRWTCNICLDNFPLFEVSIGHHVYQCLKTNNGVSNDDGSGNTIGRDSSIDIPLPAAALKKSDSRPRRRKSPIHRNSFKCAHCSGRLLTRSALIRHALIRHPNLNLYPPIPCPKCKNEYRDKFVLRAHVERCKGATVRVKTVQTVAVRELPCSKCSLKFSSKSELRTHFETHNDSNVCVICLATFSSKGKLREHQNVHPPSIDSFQCAICKKVLSSRTVLKRHIGICINAILQDASYGEKKCYVCSKTFSSKYILRYHYRRHFPHLVDSVPKCAKCGRAFYSKYSLLAHVANVCDKNIDERKTTPKAIGGTCKICNKKVAKLQRHMGIHSRAGMAYLCKECPAKYEWSESLQNHMRKSHQAQIHSSLPGAKSPVVATPVTGIASKPKGSPRRNPSSPAKNNSAPNIHDGEDKSVDVQNFKCGTCSKEFPTDRKRKAHEFIHKLQKKFKCTRCEREFTLKCNLVRHMTTLHP